MRTGVVGAAAAVILLCFGSASLAGAMDEDVFGPPGPVDEEPAEPERPSSPPEPCVTFEDWDVGGNAIPERVSINRQSDGAYLQYGTSDEHQVYQFGAGVRVKVGEKYRFTGSITAGDESDEDFSISFSDATSMRNGEEYKKKVKPGGSQTFNEEIRAGAERLRLYIHTIPSSPRDVHVYVSNMKLCHVKK